MSHTQKSQLCLSRRYTTVRPSATWRAANRACMQHQLSRYIRRTPHSSAMIKFSMCSTTVRISHTKITIVLEQEVYHRSTECSLACSEQSMMHAAPALEVYPPHAAFLSHDQIQHVLHHRTYLTHKNHNCA